MPCISAPWTSCGAPSAVVLARLHEGAREKLRGDKDADGLQRRQEGTDGRNESPLLREHQEADRPFDAETAIEREAAPPTIVHDQKRRGGPHRQCDRFGLASIDDQRERSGEFGVGVLNINLAGVSQGFRAGSAFRRALGQLAEHCSRDHHTPEDRGQQLEVLDPRECDQRPAVGDDDFNRHGRTRDRRGRG